MIFLYSCWAQELVDSALTWQQLTLSYFMKVIGIQLWIYRQWIELIGWVKQKMLVPFFIALVWFFLFRMLQPTGIWMAWERPRKAIYFLALGIPCFLMCLLLFVHLALAHKHTHPLVDKRWFFKILNCFRFSNLIWNTNDFHGVGYCLPTYL